MLNTEILKCPEIDKLITLSTCLSCKNIVQVNNHTNLVECELNWVPHFTKFYQPDDKEIVNL